MRKTRMLPIIFSVMIVVSLVFTKSVSAAEYWSFEPVVIGDAIRVYDETSGTIKTYENRTYVTARNGNEYIINTPEVYLEVKGSTGCRLNTYIDGKHVEGSHILASSGYSYGVIVRYLSPGEHTIEIKAFTGKPMDTTVKSVTVKVKISDYQDQYMKKSMEKINDGTATINDYSNVGIDYTKISGCGIDVAQVNSEVSGKNLRYEDVQLIVNKVLDNLKSIKLDKDALNNILSGTATMANYKRIGIEGITSSNLKQVNNLIAAENSIKEGDLTKEDIQILVNQLPEKLQLAQDKVSKGEGVLSDFRKIGIASVKAEEIDDVNWYLKGKDNSTLYKITTNVNKINNALRSINAGNATVTNYNELGIIKVNANNLKVVNRTAKEAQVEKGINLTRKEIIEHVNKVVLNIDASVSSISIGQGALSDYELLGITVVKVETIEDVNWYVKGKDNSTIAKITSNVNQANNALKFVNAGNGTITHYNGLGITKVNATNLKVVNAAIKNAQIEKGMNLTRKEIIAHVDKIVLNIDTSIKKIGLGQGTLSDYELLGITVVRAETISDINWYVKGKDNSTIAKITSNVNQINNALRFVNSGNRSISYFTTLGITKVNAKNSLAVSNAIKEAKIQKGSNLTRLEIIQVVERTV